MNWHKRVNWLAISGSSFGDITLSPRRPPISGAEFSQVSAVCAREHVDAHWTLALADEDFAVQEQRVFETVCPRLGLQNASIQKIRSTAQDYIMQTMEAMFAWGGHDQLPEKVFRPHQIGMSQQEALMSSLLSDEGNDRKRCDRIAGKIPKVIHQL